MEVEAKPIPVAVKHPWPYLASMFRFKSIDGAKVKMICLLCAPLHVEVCAYESSPSNLRKHAKVSVSAYFQLINICVQSDHNSYFTTSVFSCTKLKEIGTINAISA